MREHRRLSLGIKQLNDIWANWFGAHKMNDVVKGKVVAHHRFRCVCRIGRRNRRPLPHFGDRGAPAEGRARKGKPRPGGTGTCLAPGQEYDFKIIRLRPGAAENQLELSSRAKASGAQGSGSFPVVEDFTNGNNRGRHYGQAPRPTEPEFRAAVPSRKRFTFASQAHW